MACEEVRGEDDGSESVRVLFQGLRRLRVGSVDGVPQLPGGSVAFHFACRRLAQRRLERVSSARAPKDGENSVPEGVSDRV